jgi:hypothetical protein
MLGLCILFPEPQQFVVLVALSTSAVCLAFALLLSQQALPDPPKPHPD